MHKYSFRPRIGTNYEKGYGDVRIFVLGAFFHCSMTECRFYRDCIVSGNWKKHDADCPEYRKNRDLPDYEYRLSNANIIEVDSFLEGGNYPYHSIFSHFILGRNDSLPEATKEELWENLVFYNYVQQWLPEGTVLDYRRDRKMLDRDFGALEAVLKETRPNILYVWNPAIKEALENNKGALKGCSLDFIMDCEVTGLTVSKYHFYMNDERFSIRNLSISGERKLNKGQINRYLQGILGRPGEDFSHLALILGRHQAVLKKNMGKPGGMIYFTEKGIRPADSRFSSLYGLIEKLRDADRKRIEYGRKAAVENGISEKVRVKPLRWKDYETLFMQKGIHSLLKQYERRNRSKNQANI